MEEEFQGGSIDRVFSADIQIDIFIMNTVELIKESGDNPTFSVGFGGSVLGDPDIYKDIVFFGCCDKNLYAVSFKGEELWRFKTGNVVSSCTVSDDKIYVGSYDFNLYCIGVDGELVWKYETGDMVVCKPVVHKDVVYFGSRDNNIYAVTTEGKLIWKFETKGEVASDPYIHDDTLYFGSNDYKLYALTLDGKLKWSFTTKGSVWGVYVDESGVYLSSYDKNFYCLDLNGNEKWSFQIGHRLGRRPVCHNNTIYIISLDHNLYAFTKDGKLLWKFPTNDILFSLPCFDEENIYLGSVDKNIYCIDQKTGTEKWRFSCGGPIAANIILKNGIIFVGGWDCKIFALTTKGELLWEVPTSSSYMAPIEFETPQEEIRTAQIIWTEETSKEEDIYKGKEESVEFGGYGNFQTSYRIFSDYTGSKKKYAK